MPEPWNNQLYFGDNLEVLRKHIASESVDLIYLDPPFNSNATYNVLFREKDGTASRAQVEAFKDAWEWTDETKEAYWDVVSRGGKAADLLQALCSFLGRNDMMAYLSMMAVRLSELHRVLRYTGSIYLHCDPTASHYIKLLMDAVFGPQNYRTEIVWKRQTAHNDTRQGRRQHGHIHDIILFYTKTSSWTWNPVWRPYDQSYVDKFYRFTEPVTGRRYMLDNIAAPGGPDPAKRNPIYEFMGVTRYWRYSRHTMEALASQGRIIQVRPGTVPRLKRYLDEMPGVALQDIWDDIPSVQARSKERQGYPTQKPEALLERIIRASSNEGDLVLDPFCGCGTAVAVAEKLNRRWVGIDITYLAIDIIKKRLKALESSCLANCHVVGEPQDVESARALSRLKDGRHNFEHWAVLKVGATPSSSTNRADHGIDGFINSRVSLSDRAERIIVQVKSGHVAVKDIRDLVGTMKREKAIIGAFITLESPTRAMISEALSAESYALPGRPNERYPCVQIITVEELFRGIRIMQPSNVDKDDVPDAKGRVKGRGTERRNRQQNLF